LIQSIQTLVVYCNENFELLKKNWLCVYLFEDFWMYEFYIQLKNETFIPCKIV